MDGRGGRIGLVSLDLVGYSNAQVILIREMVSDSVDYLIVHSTHSHEGPDTTGLWGPDELTSGVDPEYLNFVNDSVADCVADALENMQPARIKSVTAQTDGLSLGIDAIDDGFGVADQKVLADDHLLPGYRRATCRPQPGAYPVHRAGQPEKCIGDPGQFRQSPGSALVRKYNADL